MDERPRFVARLLDGEKMAALCARFGIARKTGYKIYERYKDCVVDGSPTEPASVGIFFTFGWRHFYCSIALI